MDIKEMCKIKYSEGCLFITDNKGNILPFQTDLVINNGVDDKENTATATVSLVIDLSLLKQ